jgi:hypothetical protein
MKITTLAITAMAAASIAIPAAAHGDPTSPCSDGQVQVSNGGIESASGHREVLLIFSLAPGAKPCTITGYPGVDSAAGGPLIHATRTLSRFGFMGGVRTDTPPTVAVSPSQPAYAVVEGVGFDPRDVDRSCPNYTELRVTPPDTTDTATVATHINTCEFQVHPVNSEA